MSHSLACKIGTEISGRNDRFGGYPAAEYHGDVKPIREIREFHGHSAAARQSAYVYGASALLAAALFELYLRPFRVFGRQNIPSDGGVFIIANHTSGLDPFIMGHAIPNRAVGGPGKIELFGNALVAAYMRRLGIFPLRRSQIDPASVRAMVELYRQGRIVLVFPEGGRSRSGELKEFDTGLARLLIKLKAPIIPAGIAGAREALPMGTLIPKNAGGIAVSFGQPFELDSFYGSKPTEEAIQAATTCLRDKVREQVECARGERRRVGAHVR